MSQVNFWSPKSVPNILHVIKITQQLPTQRFPSIHRAPLMYHYGRSNVMCRSLESLCLEGRYLCAKRTISRPSILSPDSEMYAKLFQILRLHRTNVCHMLWFHGARLPQWGPAWRIWYCGTSDVHIREMSALSMHLTVIAFTRGQPCKITLVVHFVINTTSHHYYLFAIPQYTQLDRHVIAWTCLTYWRFDHHSITLGWSYLWRLSKPSTLGPHIRHIECVIVGIQFRWSLMLVRVFEFGMIMCICFDGLVLNKYFYDTLVNLWIKRNFGACSFACGFGRSIRWSIVQSLGQPVARSIIQPLDRLMLHDNNTPTHILFASITKHPNSIFEVFKTPACYSDCAHDPASLNKSNLINCLA